VLAAVERLAGLQAPTTLEFLAGEVPARDVKLRACE
jgi:hypothetical protein